MWAADVPCDPFRAVNETHQENRPNRGTVNIKVTIWKGYPLTDPASKPRTK
jgi:hypothetical protein